MMRHVRSVAVAASALLALAACSGVPTSSAPEVLGPGEGGVAVPEQPAVTPQAGAEPRQVVRDFLRANVGEPDDPRGTQLFLTPRQQLKWSDSTVTILQSYEVRLPTGTGNQQVVRVSGVQVGRLAADGTYISSQPSAFEFPYKLRKVNGQWRIDDLPEGLVVTASDFASVYRPNKLYFFDLAETHLVPDLRYTALTAPQAIASWQLAQLLAGPRQQLASAVHTELPSQLGVSRPSVTVASGPLLTVELPGSSSLDPDTKLNLAAQLMATLGQTQGETVMTITDGGNPILVPKIPDRFTKSDIEAAKAVFGVPQPPVFYIDGRSRLVDADGKPVPGPIGLGARYDLRSVAVAAHGSANYAVAATIGGDSYRTLWLGSFEKGLHKTVLSGALTRPTWAPGVHEVWLGAGTSLYRVGDNGRPLPVSAGLFSGEIEALRFSADGSRLALVIDGPGGAAQVWIAAVIRYGESVRLDSPQAITPPSYAFSDVAWNDDTTLYMVGRDGSHNPGVWQVQVDGSNLQPRPSAGLPTAPDSITAAPGGGMLPWVSAGGAVFEETSDWEGPNNHTTIGTNPVYLE